MALYTGCVISIWTTSRASPELKFDLTKILSYNHKFFKIKTTYDYKKKILSDQIWVQESFWNPKVQFGLALLWQISTTSEGSILSWSKFSYLYFFSFCYFIQLFQDWNSKKKLFFADCLKIHFMAILKRFWTHSRLL